MNTTPIGNAVSGHDIPDTGSTPSIPAETTDDYNGHKVTIMHEAKLNLLPSNVYDNITEHLSGSDMAAVRRVCKRLSKIVGKESTNEKALMEALATNNEKSRRRVSKLLDMNITLQPEQLKKALVKAMDQSPEAIPHADAFKKLIAPKLNEFEEELRQALRDDSPGSSTLAMCLIDLGVMLHRKELEQALREALGRNTAEAQLHAAQLVKRYVKLPFHEQAPFMKKALEADPSEPCHLSTLIKMGVKDTSTPEVLSFYLRATLEAPFSRFTMDRASQLLTLEAKRPPNELTPFLNKVLKATYDDSSNWLVLQLLEQGAILPPKELTPLLEKVLEATCNAFTNNLAVLLWEQGATLPDPNKLTAFLEKTLDAPCNFSTNCLVSSLINWGAEAPKDKNKLTALLRKTLDDTCTFENKDRVSELREWGAALPPKELTAFLRKALNTPCDEETNKRVSQLLKLKKKLPKGELTNLLRKSLRKGLNESYSCHTNKRVSQLIALKATLPPKDLTSVLIETLSAPYSFSANQRVWQLIQLKETLPEGELGTTLPEDTLTDLLRRMLDAPNNEDANERVSQLIRLGAKQYPDKQ